MVGTRASSAGGKDVPASDQTMLAANLMTDKGDGRGELIAALHQVTTFAEGLLDLLEKLAEAEDRGVSNV